MFARLLPLFVVLAIVQSPASSQEHLKPLEPLIGEWESSTQFNGQDVQFVAKWDWSLNRNFIASEMTISAGGNAIPSACDAVELNLELLDSLQRRPDPPKFQLSLRFRHLQCERVKALQSINGVSIG